MAHDESWQKIFDDNRILEHDFSKAYYSLSAEAIKRSVQDFTRTSGKEVRVL